MTCESPAALDAAVRAHDAAVARSGLAVWVGGEPTFTDRFAVSPEWLWAALGGEKEARARGLVRALAADEPGVLVLRTLGRQYPGEETPRWSYGLWSLRSGASAWAGPPEPLLGGARSAAGAEQEFRDALREQLTAEGLRPHAFEAPAEPRLRLAFRHDGGELGAEVGDDRLSETSVHARGIPCSGPRDGLAADGVLLLAVDLEAAEARDPGVVRLELPACPSVERFRWLIDQVATAARETRLSGLVIGGFPPPVDACCAWTTVTPDPGVIEVNMAPSQDVAGYLQEWRRIDRAAESAGLAPLRLFYSGEVADSGGGGQLTLGGETPSTSPFVRSPYLLPRLLVYLNHHPSLSYLFAFDSIGGSSQAPRADEGTRESFEELDLAIDLLCGEDSPPPATIWGSLAPFLADRFGNTHRSEVNIEKLWNPTLGQRGCAGLVELRALRMPRTPERAAALAALFRSLAVVLAKDDAARAELTDWGATLHDRFALPFYLRRDLREVLRDLEAAGMGLEEPLVAELLDDRDRLIGEVELDGLRMSVTRAIEFWPLIGDQGGARGTSRLIDPSTSRIEVTLRAPASGWLEGILLGIDGCRVELTPEPAGDEQVAVLGVRYRSWVASPGLHPTVGAHGPITIEVYDPERGAAHAVTYHGWRLDGEGYDGLPRDLEAATARRRERLVVERLDAADPARLAPLPSKARTRYTVDTRRLGKRVDS